MVNSQILRLNIRGDCSRLAPTTTKFQLLFLTSLPLESGLQPHRWEVVDQLLLLGCQVLLDAGIPTCHRARLPSHLFKTSWGPM